MSDARTERRLASVPPAGRVTHWSFDAGDALEGRRVRHAFVAVLRARGYCDEALFNAELAFGEMLGNVVRHAGGRTEIRLDTTLPDAVVDVLDEGRGFTPNPSPAHGTWRQSGRGLSLIEMMVGDFEVSRRRGGGAHVRAILRRNPAEGRAQRA